MIKATIFDLDDTLYNSTELSTHARRSAIRAMIDLGLQSTFDDAYQVLSEVVAEYGSNYNYHFDQMLKRLDVEPAKMKLFIAAGMIAYHDIKITNIRPFHDVVPTLIDLRKLEVKICILTDGGALKQYEKILRMRLQDFLDEIIISEEVGIRKPNPKLFELPLKRFNIQPSEAIYIGDNYKNDIIPCMRLGLHTVLIHRGGKYDNSLSNLDQNPPEFDITDMTDLITIIRKLNT